MEPLTYKLLAPLPQPVGTQVTDLAAYLSGMFKIGIGLAAAFAVLMIVWGGLEYILAATPGGKGDGKKKIVDALLGLLLALGAYLLLYTINPNLVKFNLSLDNLKLTTQELDLSSLDQQRFDEMIREGNAQLDQAKAGAQILELESKKYQAERDPLPADSKYDSRRKELDALIKKDAETAIALRTYESEDVRIKEHLVNGETYAKNKEFARADLTITTINNSFNFAKSKLEAVGRTEEIATLEQKKNDAIKQIEYRKRCPTDVTVTYIPSNSYYGAGQTITKPCI